MPGSARVRLFASLTAVVLLVLLGLRFHRLGGLSWVRPDDEGPDVEHAGLRAAGPEDAAGLTGRDATGPDAAREGVSSLPAPVDLEAVDRRRDLHGVVVQADGAPVAGAELQVLTYPWRRGQILAAARYDTERPGPATTTARDGTFAVRLTPGVEVALRIRAPGFATVTLEQRQPGERVRVVLQRPVTLDVFAVDPTGVALSGVSIEVIGTSGERGTSFRARGTTDARGLCRLEGLPAGGSVRLEARHGPLGGFSDPWETFGLPSEGTLRHELRIEPGRVVRGTVTDAATSLPVANARVGMGWVMFKDVRTDAEGRYALGGWTGNSYHEVHVLAEGYSRTARRVADADVVDITLERGFSLRGIVRGPDGRPLEGALVAAVGSRSDDSLNLSTATVASGPDGGFALFDLRTDMSHTLAVMATAAGRHVMRVAPPPAGVRELDVGDIRLGPSRRISGRVLGAEGEPMARTAVTVTGPLEAEGDEELAYYGREETRLTDDVGRFAFGDLCPGDYLITAGAHSAGRLTQPVVVDDEDVDDVVLRFEPRHELTVVVVDERGKPVSGATVYAMPWGAENTYAFTDETGSVVLRLPIAVQWLDLNVFHGELDAAYLQPDTERVAADAGRHRVVLADAALVLGRLLGPDGQPIRMGVVRARRSGETVGTTATGVDGRFRLAVPPGGAIDLDFRGDIWRDDAETGDRTHVRLPLACTSRNTPVPTADILLRATSVPAESRLDVRVRQPDGDAAVGFTVVVEPAPEGTSGEGTTDAAGRVRFEGLTAHAVVVTVRPPAARTSEIASLRRPDVTPGPQTVEIQLPEPLLLEGHVVDPAGAPFEDAEITCNAVFGGVMPTTRSGADGHFRLALPPDLERRVEVWATAKGPKGVFFHTSVSGVDPRAGPLRLALEAHRGW